MCDTPRVTVTATPAGTSNGHPSLLTQAVAAASPRARRTTGWFRRTLAGAGPAIRQAILPVAGLGAGSTAAFLQFGLAAGLAAVMVAAFVLDWQIRG